MFAKLRVMFLPNKNAELVGLLLQCTATRGDTMFDDPVVFNDNNEYTVRSTQEVLREYLGHIKFEENCLILDVGSGSGNVTAEVLLPAIPCTDFRLIGVDRSKVMVDYATKQYKSPRLTFRVLDINNKDDFKTVFSEEELTTGFDIIFSFYCFNWGVDYRKGYANVYSLLKPGGQIFILKAGYCTIIDVFNSVKSKEKWQPYLKDEPVVKFPYHDSTDPVQECTDLLNEVGFENIICDCVSMPHQIVGPPPSQILCNVIKQIDPYRYRVPEPLRPEYDSDIYETLNEKFYTTKGLPIDRIVVIANKPVT